MNSLAPGRYGNNFKCTEFMDQVHEDSLWNCSQIMSWCYQQQAITWANVDPDLRYLGHDESTNWGRLTPICISELTTFGSDNGLLPGRHQAIIWTNAGILLIGPSRTNISDNFFEMHTFSWKNMHLKMLSGKWWPFCLSLNMLIVQKWNSLPYCYLLFCLLSVGIEISSSEN